MSLNRKEITISSDPKNLELVENFVSEILDLLNLGLELRSKVLVCLNEAVFNSIAHGNKFEKDKKVIIQSYICSKYLYFRIIDEGLGFDFRNLPDPTSDENKHKEEGRGIFIIRKISDGIIYKDKGNIVEFKINTGGCN
jgi:serine/threonine-protein kinase RsbW